jgi:hypothetical protein
VHDDADRPVRVPDYRARAVSYQMLSGVAHARLHGRLSHLLMTSPAAQPGKVQVQMNVAADVFARPLLAGPLCATALVEHMRWFLGWDTEKTGPAATRMEATWAQIAHVPFPGPILQ